MKIQKIHLLVVFLLLIVFSVYVLRPSIYPSSYYEHLTQEEKDTAALKSLTTINCGKNKFCTDMQTKLNAPLNRKLNQINLQQRKITQLESEPTQEHLKVDNVGDTTAALGLLQTQVQNLEKILTDRFNHSIESELKPRDDEINSLKLSLYNILDENSNVSVDKIQYTELSNRIKEVIAEDRESELSELRTDINQNKETINTNKTQHSSNLNTLSEMINKKINEYQNTNIAELSNLGKEIKTTNSNVTSANSDIASVQAELEGVDLEQLTYYVGNNIVDIADISRTIATIIPYTEFRDDLRDTYREQYLQHLETEH